MRAAKLFGPRDVRIVEGDAPTAGDGQITVKVDYAGICGTDLMLYASAPFPPQYVHPLVGQPGPHTLGHEFSGTVTEVGNGVSGLHIGDLVAVQPTLSDGSCPACLRGATNLCVNAGFIGLHGGGGGFSEFVTCPADRAFPLPAPFTAQTGALVECLAVGWHAVRRANASDTSTALVVGAGPVGLAVVLALSAHGVRRIYVHEPSAQRRRLAEAYGAVAGAEEHVAVDISFDAAGAGAASFGPALRSVRPGGTVVVLAHFHEPVTVDLSHVMQSEVTVMGSIAYTRTDFEQVIDAVQIGRLDPSAMITRVVTLDELVADGLERLLTGAGRSEDVKVLVSPACTTSP